MNDLDFAKEPLLVFKDTGNKPPLGHVTDSKCKPDITAASTSLAGRRHIVAVCPTCGRKGVLRKIQRRTEETSYILSPLPPTRTTRPPCCTGMLISDEGIWFLLGIGGVGIRSMTCHLEEQQPAPADVCFIYRLYRPEHFADPSYVDMKIDVPKTLSNILCASLSADEYNRLSRIFSLICQ
jgi:predicted RNA-binding Zn-ribbon protein involved in translation (DUF1610 family)